MKPSKISDYIFLKNDIYYVVNNEKIFAKSFSLDDMLVVEDILIKYNWNLSIIQDKVITYKSGIFRIFTLNNGLLHLEVKFNKDDVALNNPQSKHIFRDGGYYFLVKGSSIVGIFNSLNNALLAETLLIRNPWNIMKLYYNLHFISEFWIIVDVVDGVLTFLYVTLDRKNIKSFFNHMDLSNPSIKPKKTNNFNIKKHKSKLISNNVESKEKYPEENKKNIDDDSFRKSNKNVNNKNTDDENKTEDCEGNILKERYISTNNLVRIDKCIFEKDDDFLIIKSNILYGSSHLKKGAYIIKFLLDNINWRFSEINNLENIVYKDDFYWVIDISDAYVRCVDFFNDYDDAFDCFTSNKDKNKSINSNYSNNVHYVNDNVDSDKNYYNVKIFKVDNKFHLTAEFNGKEILFGIFLFQRYAHIAKIILEKNNFDFDKITEENGIFFEEDLYWLVGIVDNLLNVIGSFDSYYDAFEFYKGNNYDLLDMYSFLTNNEIIDIKNDLNESIEENYHLNSNDSFKNLHKKRYKPIGKKINEFIYEINGFYHIFKTIGGNFYHFGKFDSISDAMDELDFLIKINWYL